ncbi:MAG TPA: glycoside hydrolase family 25 protein [Polyangiaceae bacterium]|jgi:GH25 family lysozyme M1 (1,4-beta-N-acetylmuramidase)
MIRGIDVSSIQKTGIDWAALARQGVRFLYAKAGDGNDAPDASFAEHAKRAHDAGIVVGAYHVGFPLPPDPTEPGREPEAQARMHHEQCGALGSGGGELPPALDLEWPVPGSAKWHAYKLTAAGVRAWALAYLEEAERLYGCLPVLYDGFPDYWLGIDGASVPSFARYPLWVVDYPVALTHAYPVDTSLLVVPQPWKRATFWQCNGGGSRLPSGEPVDSDVFLGDEAAFTAFCAKGGSSTAT